MVDSESAVLKRDWQSERGSASSGYVRPARPICCEADLPGGHARQSMKRAGAKQKGVGAARGDVVPAGPHKEQPEMRSDEGSGARPLPTVTTTCVPWRRRPCPRRAVRSAHHRQLLHPKDRWPGSEMLEEVPKGSPRGAEKASEGAISSWPDNEIREYFGFSRNTQFTWSWPERDDICTAGLAREFLSVSSAGCCWLLLVEQAELCCACASFSHGKPSLIFR